MPKFINFRFVEGWNFWNCDNTGLKRYSQIFFFCFRAVSLGGSRHITKRANYYFFLNPDLHMWLVYSMIKNQPTQFPVVMNHAYIHWEHTSFGAEKGRNESSRPVRQARQLSAPILMDVSLSGRRRRGEPAGRLTSAAALRRRFRPKPVLDVTSARSALRTPERSRSGPAPVCHIR